MNNYGQIALSFLPLSKQNFEFTVYKRLCAVGGKKTDYPDCTQRRLPVQMNAALKPDYELHWVSFVEREGFTAYLCNSHDNIYLTSDYLYHLLKIATERNLSPKEYTLDRGFNKRRVSFMLKSFPEGQQAVWLESYFLKSEGVFGFLTDFKFASTDQGKLTKHILQLSLSLDSNGKSNRNYYVDRYEKIQDFISRFHSRIAELNPSNTISKTFSMLPTHALDIKHYVFANDRSERSPFNGIKRHGPLNQVVNDPKLYFLYLEKDRPFSEDLFRALRGDTFSFNFPGMEAMFRYRLDRSNVGGASVIDFSAASIETAIQNIEKDAGDRPAVPLVIVPFDKLDTGRDPSEYYIAKHTFLRHGIPSQFVTRRLLQQKNQLKWAISNIGLQLFAKMGGQPWKIEPRTKNCLIVGIGQAHKITNGKVEKYFAYSILTESTGLYKELRVLGESAERGSYIDSFRRNLRLALEQYRDQYENFVIHATFGIRKEELDAVKAIIQSFDTAEAIKKSFTVLKFNDKNKFFAYSTTNNSMIPYESTYIQLAHDEYLVWFEGLQYQNPNVREKIERPLHVEFIYSNQDLNNERRRDYLQDALNISGANWRGFNAKSLPISVFYAHLVAEYYKEFQSLGLAKIDFETLSPWFL